ncbi:MAG: fibronectin type III domain-containing protein [Nitrospinae bacterium]|nr:fibronectin type III domain-containing protein [Nitrospinota bacterium]
MTKIETRLKASIVPAATMAIVAVALVFNPAQAAKKKKAETPQAAKSAEPAASNGSHDVNGVFFEGLLLDADNKAGKGIISIGAKNGVKKGDRFIIIRKGEPIMDPGTKKVIRIKQTMMGELEVIAANESFSDVKITKGSSDVAKNDVIRSKTSAPAGVKAKAVNFRKIEVSWNYQPEPETKGYQVYRADSPSGEFKLAGKVSSQETLRYLDEHSSSMPMEDSKYYHYKVTAINSLDRESDKSAVVSVASMGPPSPPRGFIGESGKVRSAPLKWEPHDLDVAGYKIYKGDSPTGKFELIKDIKGKGEKSFIDYNPGGSASEPKLDDSRTYYYAISAYSPFNDEGPKSQPSLVRTANPPSITKDFGAKGWQPRKVPLTWKAHSDENVRGYYIYRSSEEKGPYAQITEIKGREKTSFVDMGDSSIFSGGGAMGKLKDFTLYFYKIEAYNWAGSRSGMSEAVSATTKPAPMAPENLKATGNRPKQVPLDWRKNPEPDIKEYRVYRADDEKGAFRKIIDIPADRNYHLDSGLENSKTYLYRIQAVDVFGLEGETSGIVSGTTKSPPAPPAGLKSSREGEKVVLRWEKNREVDVVEYIVHKRGFFGWQKVGSAKDSFFVVPDMKAGSKEDFAISCVDADKLESEKSGVLTVDLR